MQPVMLAEKAEAELIPAGPRQVLGDGVSLPPRSIGKYPHKKYPCSTI